MSLFQKTLVGILGKNNHVVPKTPERILLFRIGAIGDVMMTTPLLRALAKRFPKARIDFLVGEWSAPVLSGNPHIDEVITFKDAAIFDRRLGALLSIAARIRRRRYDVAFVLDRSYLAGSFARLFGCATIGFNRAGEGRMHSLSVKDTKETHDINAALALGALIGCKTTNTKMEIFPLKKERTRAKQIWKKNRLISKKVIGICPGGGANPGQTMQLKQWPHYSELAHRLTMKGYTVVAFGGAADRALAATLPADVVDFIGKTDLRTSAALMEQCDAIVTNDSGPMHIATACAKKVVAIFGPTDPKRLGPLGAAHRIVHRNRTRCPPCNPKKTPPCYDDGRFPDCPTHACMRDLEVEEVLRALRE